MSSRDENLHTARLMETAERYDEMLDAIRSVATSGGELNEEERGLFASAYKHVINARRFHPILPDQRPRLPACYPQRSTQGEGVCLLFSFSRLCQVLGEDDSRAREDGGERRERGQELRIPRQFGISVRNS